MEKVLLIPVSPRTVVWGRRRAAEGLTEQARGPQKSSRGFSDPCSRAEPWLERHAPHQGWWTMGHQRQPEMGCVTCVNEWLEGSPSAGVVVLGNSLLWAVEGGI